MKTALAYALLFALVAVAGVQLDACPNTVSAESSAGPVAGPASGSNVGLMDVSGLITGVGGGGMGPITVDQGGSAGATGAGGSTGSTANTLAFMDAKGYAIGVIEPDGGGFKITPADSNPVIFSSGTFTLAGNAPRFITDDPSPTGSVKVEPGGYLRFGSTPGMVVSTSAAPSGAATGVVRIDFTGVLGGGTGSVRMTGGVPGSPGALSGIHVDSPPPLPDTNQSYLEGVGSTR